MTLEEKIHAAGMEQGIVRGMKKGLKSLIFQTLEIRFGQLPPGLIGAIETIQSEERLTSLHRAALQAPSLEAFAESI